MKTLPSDPFLRGYLLAAMFTEDPNPPCGCDYKTSGRPEEMISRIPEDFIAQAVKDCACFVASNAVDLVEAVCSADYDRERAGSDLWFSRGGHGVGFWDRNLGDVGDRVHKAASAMGKHYLEMDWD